MGKLRIALTVGAVGAVTTNLFHEILRRTAPAAPRVDLLGMEGFAKVARGMTGSTLTGRALYAATLASDLVANGAMFALIGFAPRERAQLAGAALGTLAGIGAATLPKPLGFDDVPVARTPATRAMTVALYAAGGVAAAVARRSSA